LLGELSKEIKNPRFVIKYHHNQGDPQGETDQEEAGLPAG